MTPAKATTPDRWGAENRVYPLSSGRPGPRDPNVTPYAIPFARAFSDPRYETAVFVTGTQSGKTDTLLDVIGCQLDTKPRPVLYVGPSRDFVADQFEPRLMALFDESQRLRSRVSRGKRNKRTIKIVNGVRVRLAWAGSATSLSSDQAGLVLVDEYSKMFSKANKGGDPFVLAKARADTYADRKIGVTSTPENGKAEIEKDIATGLEFWKVMPPDEISCQTWLRWQTGTRHHMCWRCPHCDTWFVPRFKDLKYPEGATSAEARRSTFLCCPANGCVIEETHKDAMNAEALPIAPGEFIRDDGTVGGDPIETSTYSLWASGLMSPFMSWGERVEEVLSAKALGDPMAVKAAINKIGELHHNSPPPVVTESMLADKVATGFLIGDVPAEVMRLTMGADVQGNRIVYVVRGWGSQARSWLIDRGEVFGRTEEQEVWARFALKLQEDFGGLTVSRLLIDSGFRPDKKEAGDYHKVYDFCRRWHWLAMPAKGKDRQSQPVMIRPIEATAEQKRESFALSLAHLDTDYFKSLIFSRIATPMGQAGCMTIMEDAGERYTRELLSEVRTPEGRWLKIAPDNHYLDAEALAAAAGFIEQVHRIPEGMRRDSDFRKTRQDGTGEAPPAHVVHAARSSVRERSASWASRFNRR